MCKVVWVYQQGFYLVSDHKGCSEYKCKKVVNVHISDVTDSNTHHEVDVDDIHENVWMKNRNNTNSCFSLQFTAK